MFILLHVCKRIDGQKQSDIAFVGVEEIRTMEGFRNATNITMCIMVHGPGIQDG